MSEWRATPVKPVIRGASEHGWVRRSDLGPDVWELPDGTLRRHHSKGEPKIASLPEPPPLEAA